MIVNLKRIYTPYSENDGYRVLVERLWPRGIAKEKAHVDLWLREIGPSTELRKWFNHEDSKWDTFVEKYGQELSGNHSVTLLQQIISTYPIVTLIFSSRNEEHNNAVALKSILSKN